MVRTPEEEKQRKKERTAKLFSSYKRAGDGVRGNQDQWRNMARAYVGESLSSLLGVFGFDRIPTQAELEKAWKRKLREVHPDLGGSHEETVKVNHAYEKLSKHIEDQSKLIITS